MAAARAAQAGTSSDSPSDYSQETKKECRKRLIEHAVKSLTIERDSSVCVERDHVQKVWDQLHETGEVKAFFSAKQVRQIEEEMRQWELFHDSQLQSRKPSDLRVCYLGGDDPTNDLKILVENGVLCQNVWAIEKDRKTLEAAWQSIKKSNLRNVRLFKGDILTFMKEFEGQFDIIYFDACGTLPSAKQNTLKFIGYVFLYNKLTSPGALITNFSFPPKQEQVERDQKMKAKEIEERENIMLLAKAYLKKRKLGNTLCEVTPDYFDAELAKKTDEEIYGDYINYQVIDTAFMYIPALRILSSSNQSLWDQIFIKKGDILKQLVQVLTSSPGVDEQFLGNPWIFDIGTEFSKSTNPFCKAWVNEVLPDWQLTSLRTHNIQTLLLTHILLSNSGDFMHVDKLISFFNQDFHSKCLGPLFKFVYPGFFDVPGRCVKVNMVTQLLYGQLAHPSFPVMHKMLRLSYTAKTRQMFADVFIFDKCRYVYEQFPTVDCSCFAILEIWQQMVFRMAVDGLRKHIISICNDVFQFCSIVAHFDYRFTNVWLNIPTRQKVELVLFDKLKEKGKFSVKEQNYCEALEHYNMCLELCPRSAVILTNKAFCCLKLNQPNVVLACCNEALKLEPENLKAFYRRALAFESQKNYPEAIADLERWLKIKSNRDVEQLLSEIKKLAIHLP